MKLTQTQDLILSTVLESAGMVYPSATEYKALAGAAKKALKANLSGLSERQIKAIQAIAAGDVFRDGRNVRAFRNGMSALLVAA